MNERSENTDDVTQEELDRLQRLPVEDIVEAFNDPRKANELTANYNVSKPALLVYAENLTKQLIEGLVVVNRV